MAALILGSATKLIIWGYSLPPTDTYSRWLFSTMLGNCHEVAIINPSCVSKGSGRHTYSYVFLRPYYEILLRSVKKNEINLYENFEDYVNGVTAATKYGLKVVPNV